MKTADHCGGFQNLTYTYDLVGNITQIVDASQTKSAAKITFHLRRPFTIHTDHLGGTSVVSGDEGNPRNCRLHR